MNHPKSENILKVIRNFEKVLPMAKKETHLNMMETSVCNSYHKCGTIHCAAGWYAVAKNQIEQGTTYMDGIFLIEQDLGFEPRDYSPGECQLEIWTIKNVELWGNRKGELLFSCRGAYSHPTKRPQGAQSLQDIVDHWKEVYERVVALEGKQSELSKPQSTQQLPIPEEKRKDITKEISLIPIVEEKVDVVNIKEKQLN